MFLKANLTAMKLYIFDRDRGHLQRLLPNLGRKIKYFEPI